MKYFQTILLIVFGFIFVISLLVFGGILPGFRAPKGGSGGTLILWGTLPKTKMDLIMSDVNKQYEAFFNLVYVEKQPFTFDTDLIEALATGQGPDIFFLNHEAIGPNSNKVALIPYSSYSARIFSDTFVSGASIFQLSKGLMAIPLYVDPLVMYYNKDLLTNAGLAEVPKNWPALLVASKALTKLDPQGNVTQSTVAFGEFTNNRNAKDVLSLLILQAGNSIVSLDASDKPQITLGQNATTNGLAPARSAVDFFIQFANPSKTVYNWNRSLPEASTAFINGSLAFYFGFGSELSGLATRNPHLFFDLSPVPQRNEAGARQLTFGRFTGLAISVQSKKPTYALQAIQALTSSAYAGRVALLAQASPVRRDLLAIGDLDPKRAVIFKSGLISRAWFDPNPLVTKKIFSDLVASVMTGLADIANALNTANKELLNLFNKKNG